ncbi:MAG: hypothetical protein NTW25_07695 [Candidatus Kapabacteria bacterium]|nr:hypothetical protein [Candidatus Kapabacteria bacterium]
MITKSHLKLYKGMTLANFLNEDVDYDNKFLLPKLNTKNYGKFEIYITRLNGALEKEIYYYAFKNDSLIYWGHPFQFTRSEDSTLKDIGEEAFEFSKNEYELK